MTPFELNVILSHKQRRDCTNYGICVNSKGVVGGGWSHLGYLGPMWFLKCLFFDTDEKSLFHSNIFIIKLIWFSPLILLLRPALYFKKLLTSSCFKQLGQLLKQISWAFGTLFTYLKGWKASLCNDSEGSQITFAFEQWVGWCRWWIFIGECLKEGIPLIIHKLV